MSEAPIRKTKSRKALNAANLEALGAARLAAILLAVADDLPATKRRLRLELAAEAGAGELAAEIEKHLDAVAAARGKVNWRKIKALRQELDLTRTMIAVRLAGPSPGAAVRLLLRFVQLERGVLARTKDARGEIAQAFAEGVEDLARVAATVPAADVDLAEGVFDTLSDASVDAMGAITRAVVPALDAAAIAVLRGRIETEMAPRRRISAGWRDALLAVLDAQGDADAYAATFSPSELVLPPVGARIAQRFLRAGRIEAAERALAASNPHAGAGKGSAAPAPGRADAGLLAWESVRIDVLEAKGDGVEAQEARWAAFERDLSRDHLAEYLRRLADFDDVVAADRAIDYAAGFRPFSRALDFLVAWPALPQAAALVLERTSEIDGLAVETNAAAARALEGRYPLAATLLLRAMITAVFRFSQVELYPHAWDWLDEAASLAVQIDDFQNHPDHAAFEAAVRASRPGRHQG